MVTVARGFGKASLGTDAGQAAEFSRQVLAVAIAPLRLLFEPVQLRVQHRALKRKFQENLTPKSP